MGIADIAKRTLWFDARDLTGANGSDVPQWRSHDGAILSSSYVAGNAPTLATGATPTGANAVNFPGSKNGFFGGRTLMRDITSVTASTTFGDNNRVEFAVDGYGSSSNYYLSTVVATTVDIQFGSSFAATGVTLTAQDTTRNPKDFTVKGWNGSSWVTVGTVTGAAPSTSGTTYSFSNSTSYSLYRLDVTAVNGGSAVALRDIAYTGAPTVTVTGATAGEVWAVVKSSGAGNNPSFYRHGSSAAVSYYTFSGQVYDDFGHSTRRNFSAASWTVTDFHIIRITLSGGVYTYYVDGVSKYTVSGVTPSWPATFAIGMGSFTTDRFNGQLAALIFFNDALTTTEATTVSDELTAAFISAPSSITGTGAATAPAGSASGSGTVTVPVTGSGGAVAPSGSADGSGVVVVTGSGGATAPDGSASGSGTVTAVTVTGSGNATAPDGTADGAGTVTGDGSVTGSGGATAPDGTADGGGVVSGGVENPTIQVGTATYTSVSVIGLAPAADLAETVPVQRQSYLMPALDAAHPVYQPLRDYDVTVGLVGTVHLWIDHQDVTFLRGKPSRILRWDSEAPWGDKAAMFEFPQLDPWDVPGAGDLTFLRPDAPVTIGMVDSLGAVRVLWTGFLDSRGNGLGESESYTWEAKGTLWAAAQVIHEPVPYLPPTDIGILVAKALNGVLSRRFHVRERRTGILTRTRGARDQWVWQYVQDLLSEAWTEDGRQWTLVEVAPGEFDIVLKKAMTTVDATVAYGTPLVDIDLRIDESTRVDEVFARGYSPAGGTWANVFYPGLELARPPAYPYSNPATTITLGTTDAMTDSGSGVSDWQERARKLGYTTMSVTGVMSSAWVTVVRRVQGALGILVDGVIGPQTWNATFDSADLDIDLTPLRLPMAMKPWTRPVLYGAAGVVTGPNPNYDPSKVVRQVALSLGQITKADARPLMRTYLAVHGEAVATGTVTFIGCPNEVDRTRLTHGDNLKILGFEGRDVVVQLASKSVALDDERSQYVVSFTVDESARDALTVEQLLERNRAALADPSRRPGNPNRDTRSVKDQGFSWDAESPCGVLPKTAVNGAVGLWSCITIPFAEVGQLAGLRLHGTHPFAVGIFASLRITENKLASIIGNPFSKSDPWRPVADSLDEYGWIAGWGEQGDGCGFSPGTEPDGFTFTGDFIEASTLEYITETPPYVTIALYMRGSSGYVWGEFEPAEQT